MERIVFMQAHAQFALEFMMVDASFYSNDVAGALAE